MAVTLIAPVWKHWSANLHPMVSGTRPVNRIATGWATAPISAMVVVVVSWHCLVVAFDAVAVLVVGVGVVRAPMARLPLAAEAVRCRSEPDFPHRSSDSSF